MSLAQATNFKGNAGLISTMRTFQGPNVTVGRGYQNIVAKETVTASQDFEGASAFTQHSMNHLIVVQSTTVANSPAQWVDNTNNNYLGLIECPIGSCVKQLILNAAEEVVGASIFLRVAGAELATDFTALI